MHTFVHNKLFIYRGGGGSTLPRYWGRIYWLFTFMCISTRWYSEGNHNNKYMVSQGEFQWKRSKKREKKSLYRDMIESKKFVGYLTVEGGRGRGTTHFFAFSCIWRDAIDSLDRKKLGQFLLNVYNWTCIYIKYIIYVYCILMYI